MQRGLIVASSLLILLGICTPAPAAQEPPAILALGNIGFLDIPAIQASTGDVVVREMGTRKLRGFVAVILADISYAALPREVQDGLAAYVSSGGAVLVTGGAQSWGAGGYQPLSSILPFTIRGSQDWGAVPFRETVPIQPGHPILAGVQFVPIGTVNWVSVAPGATEILRSAGGGTFPAPLIAEMGVGSGLVLGFAFDPNQLTGMSSRALFIKNTITYLLASSRV